MDNNSNFTSDEEVIILLDEEEVVPVEESYLDTERGEIEMEYEPAEETVPAPAPVPVSKRKVTKTDEQPDEYETEDYDEDDDDEDEGGFLDGIIGKMLIVFGIAIAILAIVVGIRFMGNRNPKTQGVDFSQLGNGIAGSGVIGGNNVSDITKAEGERRETLLEIIQNYDYDEVEEENGITVVDITLTSILKDLKIKFVNSKDKLIAGVPFTVDITKPDGTTMTVSDDDKDGIIYLSEIAGGSYGIKLQTIEGLEGYYDFETSGSKSATVKTQLDYQKVNVKNEVKKASDEVSKKEDTKKNETEEESKLKDTVAYVVSDKIQVSAGYVEINKTQYITDPAKKIKESLEKASISRFMKLAEGGETPPAPEQNEHTCNIEYTSNGNGTHNSSCTVGGEGCTYTPQTNVACSDTDNDNKCELCHGDIIKKECEHTDKKYVSISTTAHKVVCADSACNKVITESESCTWNSENKCDKGCGNTKTEKNIEVSGVVTYKDSAQAVQSKVTFNGNDKTKNVWTLTAAPKFTNDDDKNEIKGYTYSWHIPANDVLKVTSTDLSKEAISVEILKPGKVAVQCNIKYTVKDDSTAKSGEIVCVQEIEVGGMQIDFGGITKKSIFVGESITINATVTGGTNNTLDWTLSPSDTGGCAGVVIDKTTTRSATINGIKAGSFDIIVTSTEDKSITKKLTIVVANNPKNDTATKLLTDGGLQVYVKNGTKYTEATVSDYYKDGTKLYILGGEPEFMYTGWWTQNGKTYYYDSNGKKVTGDQVILGAKYSFNSDGSLKSGTGLFGIDVSTWNGSIDWNKVAKSGVSYAIIRCGFRGSTAGGLYIDNKFEANIKNATAAGIKVGVYFFSQAVNEAEAIEEASWCMDAVEGYKLAYPIFIDVESSGGRADSLSKDARTAVVKAFCKTVSNGGYKAGVYANKNWFTTKMNASELTAYTIWLAQYASQPSYTTTRYDMWQYSAKGSINGISGEVDLNLSYLGY